MINPKTYKPSKANITPGTVVIVPDAVLSQETVKIRARAYELYESRGREPGSDEQDWLRAEQEILKP